MIKKYIKKPVVVEAVQWDGEEKLARELIKSPHFGGHIIGTLPNLDVDLYAYIGGIYRKHIPKNYWIIFKDEKPSCIISDEEFRETYEEVNDD